MPLKPKFTKEEIIDVAISYINKNGASNLTARNLAKELNSSACPIFTCFNNMDEVLEAVKNKVFINFNQYLNNAFVSKPAFKSVGYLMIKYAKDYKNLFKLIFMESNDKQLELSEFIESLGELKNKCIDVIMNDYNLTKEEGYMLFEHLWIYSFGLATLVATQKCNLSDEIISEMLSKCFNGMLNLIQTSKGKI